MATVRLNVAANFVGRIWTTALGFLFIPVYLRFLGIEAYGLVGFYSTLQAVFGLLDLGLSITIHREMARLTAEGDRVQQRDLLRTLEAVYWGVSLTIGLGVLLLAPLIATHWVHAEHLTAGSITMAIRLMGIVICMQLPWGFYQGALMGLERQVFINGTLIVMGTLRSAGAALVLWLVSPTIGAFFLWQAAVSITHTAWVARAAWRTIPGASPRFVPQYLRTVWIFAATIAANALIGTVLTQMDKVVLSRLLTLEQFGYYALAGSIASIAWLAIVPVNQALFPRFTQLVQLRDEGTLATVYHRAAQTLAVVILPLSVTIVFFAWGLIATWTRNPVAADNTVLVVRLLIIGTTLNGIASLAGQLQAAAGWPQLVMFTNLISAILLVPSMVFASSRFGPAGAAGVWILLNSGYLIFTIPIMHRRLLRGELGRWYWQDVLLPAIAAVVAAGGVRLLVPDAATGLPLLAASAAAWLLASIATVAVAPLVRSAVMLLVAERPWLHLSWSRS